MEAPKRAVKFSANGSVKLSYWCALEVNADRRHTVASGVPPIAKLSMHLK